jgi:hypothetical protein
MFTAHTKSAEMGFQGLPHSSVEDGEFRSLERTLAKLAENEQWLAKNADKILPASEYEIVPTSENDPNARAVLVKEDEYVLRCLGAAVMMRWSTLPTKLRRELFDHASSLGEFEQGSSIGLLEQTARLKGLIARFLHSHNGSPTVPLWQGRAGPDQETNVGV